MAKNLKTSTFTQKSCQSRLRTVFLGIVVINLFNLIGQCQNELATNGDNKVDSSSPKNVVAPKLLDSLEGAEFLSEIALYKYSSLDQGFEGQDNSFPGKLGVTVFPTGSEGGFSDYNKAFVEILSSLDKVYKKSFNITTSEKGDLSTFKTWCNRYPKIPEPGATLWDFNSLCDIVFNRECLSSNQLLKILENYSQTQKELSVSQAIARICPLMLFQNQRESCSKIQPENLNNQAEIYETTELPGGINEPSTSSRTRPDPSAVWGFGFLFVTVVSCCSLVGVALLPFLSKSVYHTVLVLFEGLAVGSLSASALFHLIPQAFGLQGQDIYHDYLWKSLIIFVGIYVFFIMERCMKIIIQRKQKRKLKKTLRNVDTASLTLSPSDLSSNGGDKVNHDGNNTPEILVDGEMKKINDQIVEQDPDTQVCLPPQNNNHTHHGHNHFPTTNATTGKQEIATVAWMIIFGDGLHNFIDGLSMGAAFSDSILSGISISVAVICEEFPHELGDFAVLLSAGMTMKQALMYNFLSACTCYIGLIFGIILGDFSDSGQYIFAFAGGMFLYISLVDMVNELSEALESASEKGTLEMIRVFGLQNLGIIIGVVVMFVMARYSEKINFSEGLNR